MTRRLTPSHESAASTPAAAARRAPRVSSAAIASAATVAASERHKHAEAAPCGRGGIIASDDKLAVCRSSRSRTCIRSFLKAPRRGRSASSPNISSRCGRFKEQKIQDTVVFFGSARVDSRERAERALRTLRARGVQRRGRAVRSGAEQDAQSARVGALLRGSARARAAADGVEPDAEVRASSLRRHVGRRPRHHGGGQPRRARSRRQDDRPQHPPAVRAGRRTRTSPRGCTSSSITSSCASSGSPTWRRRWWCFPAASARATSCSRSSRSCRPTSCRRRSKSFSTAATTGSRCSTSKPMAEWGAIAEKDLELLHYADTPADAFERLQRHLIDAPSRAARPRRKPRRRGSQKRAGERTNATTKSRRHEEEHEEEEIMLRGLRVFVRFVSCLSE